jgi:hypothetical protein
VAGLSRQRVGTHGAIATSRVAARNRDQAIAVQLRRMAGGIADRFGDGALLRDAGAL